MFNKPSVETPCNLNHSYNCVWFSLPDSLRIVNSQETSLLSWAARIKRAHIKVQLYQNALLLSTTLLWLNPALIPLVLCLSQIGSNNQIFFFFNSLLFSTLGALDSVLVLRSCCVAFFATFLLLACEIKCTLSNPDKKNKTNSCFDSCLVQTDSKFSSNTLRRDWFTVLGTMQWPAPAALTVQ